MRQRNDDDPGEIEDLLPQKRILGRDAVYNLEYYFQNSNEPAAADRF